MTGLGSDSLTNVSLLIECAARCTAFRTTHDDWTACNAFHMDKAANECNMAYVELDWLYVNMDTGTEKLYVDAILPP